jgi:hypothetical protein
MHRHRSVLDTVDVANDQERQAPKFGVLDIVEIHWPDLPHITSEEGPVVQVRDYGNGRFRYSVGGPSELSGILDEDWLAPTGRQASIDEFWSGPLRLREIVKVSRKHPKPSLRGWYGVITSQYEGPPTSYEVTFTYGPFGAKRRTKDIDAQFLKPTGERLHAEPTPRPVTHYSSNGKRGLRPAHGFTVLDDLDQYL